MLYLLVYFILWRAIRATSSISTLPLICLVTWCPERGGSFYLFGEAGIPAGYLSCQCGRFPAEKVLGEAGKPAEQIIGSPLLNEVSKERTLITIIVATYSVLGNSVIQMGNAWCTRNPLHQLVILLGIYGRTILWNCRKNSTAGPLSLVLHCVFMVYYQQLFKLSIYISTFIIILIKVHPYNNQTIKVHSPVSKEHHKFYFFNLFQ